MQYIAQVPFSSLNFGTDTSYEGRLVIEQLLLSTDEGLGNGETPIFPVSVFKMKKGVSAKPGDPNYDLFQLACKVSARRLFPNFGNVSASYNIPKWEGANIDSPDDEYATMGCRTRVFTNVRNNGINGSVGRGNLSFTSINLPRLGLLAGRGNIDKFFELLDERMELVHRQLKERFEIQCLRHPRNYPFLMGQGIWKGSEDLGPDDDIRDALQNGTLTVGFIGLAETLVALTGKHHGESEESQELGLKIIGHMRELTDKWTQEEKMNYSVIGTPAEGLSGRFVKIDAKRFGKIPGITDREYYTNSQHIPVYYPISAFKKIQIEAPYHALENGGHICYIEMDGDPAKNVKAFEKVVQYAYDHDIGYFAVNHANDYDSVCGYVGIIGDVCPRCGRRDGEPMTEEMWEKLHNKYAYTPNASSCGYCGDPNEERDRQKNLNTLDNE